MVTDPQIRIFGSAPTFFFFPKSPAMETTPGMSTPALRYLCTHFDQPSDGDKKLLIARLESPSVTAKWNPDGPTASTCDPIAVRQIPGTPGLPNEGQMMMRSVQEPGSRLAYVYTIGYTKLLGYEMIVRGVHPSLVNAVAKMLNACHPERMSQKIENGHSMQSGGIVFVAEVLDANTTALLQATQMTLSSRGYGPENFGVIEMIPIFVANKKNPKGWRGQKNDHPDWDDRTKHKNLHACNNMCGVLSSMEGVLLSKCSRCKNVRCC